MLLALIVPLVIAVSSLMSLLGLHPMLLAWASPAAIASKTPPTPVEVVGA